jgi:hypothetical protein
VERRAEIVSLLGTLCTPLLACDQNRTPLVDTGWPAAGW